MTSEDLPRIDDNLPTEEVAGKKVPAESIAAVESSDDDVVVEPKQLTLREARASAALRLCASKQFIKGLGKVSGRDYRYQPSSAISTFSFLPTSPKNIIH